MQLHTQSCCRKATCRIITTLYISTSVWHAAEQSRHMKAFRDLMLVLSLDGPDIHCFRGENFEARPRTAREENGGGSRNIHMYMCTYSYIYIYTCTCIITTTLILEDYPPRKDFEMCVAQEKATSLIE